MKRLFITLMAALTAVMSFSQVTLPANAKQESWWIESTFNYQENGQQVAEPVSEEMLVAFDGNDIYFNFPNPVKGSTWIKGTKDSESGAYIFARAQEVGDYYGTMYYFSGYDTDGLTDFSFHYSEATESYSCIGYIMISTSTTDASTAIGYFEGTTVTKSKPVPDELIEAPANLKTEDYFLTGKSITYGQDGSVSSMDDVSYTVKVGFSGSDVYIQGLSQAVPTAWAKGTLDDDDVTFEKGQFMGKVSSFSSYLMGQQYGTQDLTDFECAYDATTGTFTARQYLVINAYKTSLAPFAVYAGVKITKLVDEPATPANPSITKFTAYTEAEGYGTLELSIPQLSTTGSALIPEKLSYQLYQDINGTVSDYVFSMSDYEKIEADMVEIPYNYTDNWDINPHGQYISLFANSLQFRRIGVQSIYRGGNEEKRSDIIWYTISTDGIQTLRNSENEKMRNAVYNLAGQKLSNGTREALGSSKKLQQGIYIINGKKVIK